VHGLGDLGVAEAAQLVQRDRGPLRLRVFEPHAQASSVLANGTLCICDIPFARRRNQGKHRNANFTLKGNPVFTPPYVERLVVPLSSSPKANTLAMRSPSRDWLPSGHVAWFIHDAVESLNVDKLRDDCYTGERPCPPRVMLRLLIYAYCTGAFSSRRIAANIEVSVALRVLAAGHEPSQHTICRFREENLDEFHRLFMRVVEIAREARLFRLGAIAIRSSMAKANASERKAIGNDAMPMEKQRLREEIAKLTRAAKKQDELEDVSSMPRR